MSTREIPDGPAADYKFLAIVSINGHGRPRQLEKEYREALEKIIHNEFGRNARVTSLTRAAYDSALMADAGSGSAGIPGDISIVVDEPDQRQDDAGNNPGAELGSAVVHSDPHNLRGEGTAETNSRDSGTEEDDSTFGGII